MTELIYTIYDLVIWCYEFGKQHGVDYREIYLDYQNSH